MSELNCEKDYCVYWLETNLIKATLSACSPEEAIELAIDLDADNIETVYNGEPHPGTHLCVLEEDEVNSEDIQNAANLYKQLSAINASS